MDRYIVIKNYALSELTRKVQNKIKEGYIPIGGISIGDFKDARFFQSMIHKSLQSQSLLGEI